VRLIPPYSVTLGADGRPARLAAIPSWPPHHADVLPRHPLPLGRAAFDVGRLPPGEKLSFHFFCTD